MVLFSILAFGQSKEISNLHEEINEHKKLNSAFEKDTLYISLLNQLAIKYRYFKSDTMLSIAQETSKLSNAINYRRGEIISLKVQGDFQSDHGKVEKAIDYYTNALKIIHETQNEDLTISLMNDLAVEYQYLGDYSKALSFYFDAIDLAESSDDLEMLSILNENIAGMYAEQKDYDQALHFYEKAKKINNGLGDDIFSAKTLTNLAELYSNMGKYDYALFNVNQSIETLEKHKIYDWLAYTYSVKGEIYLKQEKYKWALYWFDQANLLYKKVEDKRMEIELYNGYAEVYFGLEEDSLATTYALKSFMIADKISSLKGKRDGAETLYKIFKKQGDYVTALGYHEIFQNISDSLSRDENQNSLILLKTKINYEKQKQAIIDDNKKAMAKQRNYIYIGIVILIILLSTLLPLYFNQKKLVKLYNELKLKTNTIKEREEELKKIDKTKNQLFSIIGHDLRGPIGGLQGLLKLFVNNEIPQSEFIGFIPKLRSDVDHILFTLNNLLSWGQAQLKNNIVKPGIITLRNSVNNCVKLLGENAKAKRINIVNKIPYSAFIWVDSNQIEIIIRNLLSNAIKFTPENGTVYLDAEQETDHWKILVRDTGVGMTKDICERIFVEDQKVTTFGTHNEKGTGLGLSLCKEMVENNKGRIWVESEPRKGTTFYFTIPRVSPQKFKQAS